MIEVGCLWYKWELCGRSGSLWQNEVPLAELGIPRGETSSRSKGSVSQLMDDLDLINSVEQVEVMVNSIQKGAENQNTSALVMLENLLGVFLICSALFRSKSNVHEYAARLRGASTR